MLFLTQAQTLPSPPAGESQLEGYVRVRALGQLGLASDPHSGTWGCVTLGMSLYLSEYRCPRLKRESTNAYFVGVCEPTGGEYVARN